MWRLDNYLQREVAKANAAKESAMNFQQKLSLLAGGRGITDCGRHVLARIKANPRRFATGLFWGIYGVLFLLGDWTFSLFGDKRAVHIAVGIAVVVLALIAGFGGVRLGSYHQRSQEEKTASAKRLGNKLFYPALAIPVVTVIGVLLFNNLPSWQVALFGAGQPRDADYSVLDDCRYALIEVLKR